MKKVWITYSWNDNEDKNVDFIAQELRGNGLDVHLDRWSLIAGKRLWEQIEENISNPELCDAWIIYATQNSLDSEGCREEYAYALDRSLHSRGEAFPIIAVFPTLDIDRKLIPAGIRTCLFVSLMDEDWMERILSGVNNSSPSVFQEILSPFMWKKGLVIVGDVEYHLIELRPRAGMWSPCFVGIPVKEKEKLQPGIFVAPNGDYSFTGILPGGECISLDRKYWMLYTSIPATPTSTILLTTHEDYPSDIIFGKYLTEKDQEGPQFKLEIKT